MFQGAHHRHHHVVFLQQMILQSSRVVSLGTLSDGAIVERIVLSTGIRGDQVMDGWVMILRADDDKVCLG